MSRLRPVGRPAATQIRAASGSRGAHPPSARAADPRPQPHDGAPGLSVARKPGPHPGAAPVRLLRQGREHGPAGRAPSRPATAARWTSTIWCSRCCRRASHGSWCPLAWRWRTRPSSPPQLGRARQLHAPPRSLQHGGRSAPGNRHCAAPSPGATPARGMAGGSPADHHHHGAMEALSLSLQVLTEPGDWVVVSPHLLRRPCRPSSGSKLKVVEIPVIPGVGIDPPLLEEASPSAPSRRAG